MHHTITNREQAIAELRELEQTAKEIRATFGIPLPGKNLYSQKDCGWLYSATADGFGGATASRVYHADEEQELDFVNSEAAIKAINALYNDEIKSLEDYPDE